MQELKSEVLFNDPVFLDVHNQINHLLVEAEKVAMRDTANIDDKGGSSGIKFMDDAALNNWLSNLIK